jgi:hypothetical protein
VGAAIARNAWPSRIGRDGTLYVHTVDSVWAFELGHRAGEIAERLRVSGVRFAPGPLPERGSAPADEVERARLQPDSAHLEQGEALAASIEDPELREVVARAAAASLARAASGRVV